MIIYFDMDIEHILNAAMLNCHPKRHFPSEAALTVRFLGCLSVCCLVMERRQDELWRVFMHTTSITGFFLGGFAGWHAFHVRDDVLTHHREGEGERAEGYIIYI